MGLSTLEYFPWRFLYLVMLYVCRYGKFIHIYICLFVNIHLLCNYYILAVYLLYKVTTFFSPMFFLLFLRNVIDHQNTYNWHAWYISWVQWHGMVNEFSSSMVRNFIHVVHISFHAVHILLYIPKTFFQHHFLVGMANHIMCTFASEFSINFLCIDGYDNSLPGCSSHEVFANTFADFFMNQIEIIRSQFKQSNLYTPPSQNCANLTQFRPISDEKTLQILNSMQETTCDVYLWKINFLIAFTGVLFRTWTQIIKKSLLNGSFLQSWKKAVTRLLMKSCELHREFKNYQPISNLLFISKWTAKTVLLQLSTFFGDQIILATYQSA